VLDYGFAVLNFGDLQVAPLYLVASADNVCEKRSRTTLNGSIGNEYDGFSRVDQQSRCDRKSRL